MKIRCSQLPLLSECAASAHSEVSINTTSEASGLGTMLHAQIRAFIDGKAVAVSDELDWFKTAWLALNVQDVKTEVEVKAHWDGIDYSGHIDAVCNNGNLLIDWKTGRGEMDYRAQMIGYAALYILQLPFAGVGRGSITIAVINTTTRLEWHETLTNEEVMKEFDEFHKKIKNWNGEYNVGDHCKYCPSRLFCRANITSLSSALELVGESGITKKIDTARLVDVYPLISQLIKKLEDAQRFIKNEVYLHGSIAGECGELRAIVSTRDEVIPKECALFLTGLIGQERFYDTLKIGIGDLESAVIEWFKENDVDDILAVEPLLTKPKNGEVVKFSQDELKKWLRDRLRGLDALTSKPYTIVKYIPAKKEITGD